AISIARRLLDPLGELIKIDPKSIGVGQYQHDVNQKDLSSKLDFTVEKIVNEVGVDVNTTSAYLLAHISGINHAIAQEIITYRSANKGFKNRKELLKVKKLGPKAYEQAAGFLRITNSKERLDQTIIHPESYPLAYKIINYLGLDISDLGQSYFSDKLQNVDLKELTKLLDSDFYTTKQVVLALQMPNQDIRDYLDKPQLKQNILSIEDLKEGMVVEGVVRNVVDFGAFIDIGLKNDALLHLSKITNEYIKHPSEKLSVNQIVKATIINVDLVKGKVGLSMK
ncbi:MAG: helix-hairpin-helix domain-containing protein, partial [Bacilli bacterium]